MTWSDSEDVILPRVLRFLTGRRPCGDRSRFPAVGEDRYPTCELRRGHGGEHWSSRSHTPAIVGYRWDGNSFGPRYNGCWYCDTPDSACPVHRDGDG